MAYRVEITKTAEVDLHALCSWVIAQAPHQGALWFNGLETAILSLDREPRRCPVAPESVDTDHPIRVLHYGRRRDVYRIFFAVDDRRRVVRVLHIRHAAQRRITVKDEPR